MMTSTSRRTFVRMSAIRFSRYALGLFEPHPIICIESGEELRLTLTAGSYHVVSLLRDDGRRCTVSYHRILSSYLVYNPHPDRYHMVDHINHDRTDNRVSNLRWVDASLNQYNRSSTRDVEYDFVEALPDASFMVTRYIRHRLREIYYSTSSRRFYYRITPTYFRVLHYLRKVNPSGTLGSRYVKVLDTTHTQTYIYPHLLVTDYAEGLIAVNANGFTPDEVQRLNDGRPILQPSSAVRRCFYNYVNAYRSQPDELIDDDNDTIDDDNETTDDEASDDTFEIIDDQLSASDPNGSDEDSVSDIEAFFVNDSDDF